MEQEGVLVSRRSWDQILSETVILLPF